MPPAFVVLVPVKPPSIGKSRLAEVGETTRRDLAAAFAADTVRACLRATLVERVLVTTDDAGFATMLGALGAETMPDGVADDLNAALVQAAAEAGRRWPALRPVAVCADLPALRPDELDAVLAEVDAADGPAFVPDLEGVGTTLFSAPAGVFRPSFGPGSRAAHRAGGALEVGLGATSVRHDVDQPGDLDDARHLGLGVSTEAVWSRAGAPHDA